MRHVERIPFNRKVHPMGNRARGLNHIAPVFAVTLCLALTGVATSVFAAEKAVPAENNPPGDIPDPGAQ